MDRLETLDCGSFGDAGGLPDSLRARVRRQRAARRAKICGGLISVCVLLIALVVMPFAVDSRGAPDASHSGEMLLTIDDPIFDSLEHGLSGMRADSGWRANRHSTQ